MTRRLAVLPLLALGAWNSQGWAAEGGSPRACTIKGRVVSAVNGEPLRKVQVTLHNPASDASFTTTTGESGTYTLNGLDPGTYEFTAEKSGYVRGGNSISLQGTGAGWCSTPSPGQNVADAVVRLMPAAILAGRVADRDGEPVAGATVQAVRARGSGTAERYSVAASATTNDRGEYRIFGLPPGRYYLGSSW